MPWSPSRDASASGMTRHPLLFRGQPRDHRIIWKRSRQVGSRKKKKKRSFALFPKRRPSCVSGGLCRPVRFLDFAFAEHSHDTVASRRRVIPARARRPVVAAPPPTPRSSPFVLHQPAPHALETDTRGRTRSPPPTRPSDIGNASSFRELHVEPRLDELTRADACRRSRARRAPRRAR